MSPASPRHAMKTSAIFLLLALPLLARPSLVETLDVDPGNPPLGTTFLPLPAALTQDDVFGHDYGHAVAIRGDTAFVSAPAIDDAGADKPGNVYIFRRSGDQWLEFQTLGPPDGTNWLRFGESLDLSDDGSVLVVGSDDIQQDTANVAVTSGAYIFLRHPLNGKYEFHQKLVPTAVEVDQWTGKSVAISGDWIVLGAPGTDEIASNSGSAYAYRRDPATGRWIERQRFLPDANPNEVQFGETVTLDGRNLCIAAPYYLGSGRDGGRLYFYHLDEATDTWTREADFDKPNAPSTYARGVGKWMDMDGDRLITSFDYSENSIGHSYLYERTGGTWVQRPRIQSDPDGSGNNHQTNSPYSGRRIVQAGDLFICSGLDVGGDGGSSGTTTMLGEIMRYDGGNYQSAAILGDIAVKTQPPTGFTHPLDARARLDGLGTDGTSIIFSMQNNVGPGGQTLVAVIAAEATEVIPRIRPLLFYDDADPAAPQNAAFAYQTLLYQSDGLGGFSTRHDEIDTLYDTVNRDNAAEAEELLRFSYPTATGSSKLEMEGLFLDLAYGRAAAQLIISKNTVANLDQQRLEVRANLFLDEEITTVQSALDQSAAGINEYLNLLQDPLDLPPVAGDPAGRAIFAKLVPARALISAIDTDADPDSDPDELLSGYKDLVLLYELLLHHIRSAADLAHLLTARDTPADATAARALIGDTQRLVFEQRNLLNALFSPAILTPALRDELGLTRISGSIDVALSDLSAFEQNLNGTINLLGYEPDFLMLVQTQDQTGELLFDSFDAFRNLLERANSPLNVAKSRRSDALNAIASYGSNQDALESEFTLIATSGTSAIIPRLTEIVGVPYSVPPTPAYQNPQDNVGSDIWQQVQSIEAARLRILRNSTEISNLKQKVTIERNRRAAEAGINAALSASIISFGNQQASMTEEIGRIEAAQKAADALTELFEIENITKVITGVGVVNAAAQAAGEIGKANLEASKERLAATQDAAIRDADDDILANNSDALIKTLLLEMNTLLIDSQEAALLLRQEAGRLTGLVCEKADLERRLSEVDDQLAARYFADPIHRLRALNQVELASISFRNARKWLFFAARALEYKWNTPVALSANDSSDGRSWRTDDLFKLRNADELDRFFIALKDWDLFTSGNRTFVPYDDWFSLREDYFGYDKDDDLDGTPLFYDVTNPATGLVENVDAVTAFRFELTRALADVDNNGSNEIAIRFDTLRRTEYDTAANGGQGGFLSTFFTPSTYLDRIEGLRVFVRGPHQFLSGTDGDNTIPVELSYLGTSVIRNEVPGLPADPNRPDRVAGEFTSYPNRYYRFYSSGYRFEEGLNFDTGEALKILPARSRSALEPLSEPSSIRAFSERSVATSSWLMVLAPNNGINPGSRLRIDEIDDIEIYIDHRAVSRPE